ncbi:MAG: DUF452 family protein [Succinivibrio sp.]|nr:DUF452 family protein [Succinivibrio sp.]
MQIALLNRNENSDKLRLIFSGYGQDSKIFEYLCRDFSGNLALVYDYRSMDFDESVITPFKTIDLITWSMGVMIAPKVLLPHNLLDRVVKSTSINGTIYGIDDKFGIVHKMWQATIDSINEKTALKFYQRMCTDKAVFDEFLPFLCQRSVDELKNELEFIQKINEIKVPDFKYNTAYVGLKDRIFPSVAQLCALENIKETKVITTQTGHFDINLFKQILSND